MRCQILMSHHRLKNKEQDSSLKICLLPSGNPPILGASHHLEVIGTGTTYIPAGPHPTLVLAITLRCSELGLSISQQGTHPTLVVSHHLGVIKTGATYIPAGNSPNLGVSHHLEVIGTGATYIPAGNSLILV